MKLLVIETKKSKQSEREHDYLKNIFKTKLNIDLQIDYVIEKDVLDRLAVENGNIKHTSIYNDYGYDWVHLRLTDSQWKKLNLDSNLYGQYKAVRKSVVTYGRWSQKSKFKQAHLFFHEFPKIPEHTVGMVHEYLHSKDNGMAVTHSFMYGYDKLYTKAQETSLKPQRYMQKSSILKAIEYVFKTSSTTKVIDEVKAVVLNTPTGARDVNFDKAVEHILKFEGGYVNHPSDPGGETNFGISKRSYPNVDIKNLTVQKAKDIYFKDYWQANKCDKMPYETALIVFDMSVNMGLKRTAQMLQNVLGVTSDGMIGNITLGAIAKLNLKELAIELSKQRQLYYQSLKTFGTFGKGWTNRTFDILIEINK